MIREVKAWAAGGQVFESRLEAACHDADVALRDFMVNIGLSPAGVTILIANADKVVAALQPIVDCGPFVKAE